MLKKEFEILENAANDDKRMFVRSGYECLRTNLMRLNRPPISCEVSNKVIIDKLKQHLNLIAAETVRVRGKEPLGYDATNCIVVKIGRATYSQAYLTREHDLSTIALQKLEYRAAKLQSVLLGFEYRQCDDKGNRTGCHCSRLEDLDDRCKTCKEAMQIYGSNPYFKRLFGYKNSGPVPCVCIVCLKYNGKWKDDDFCECGNITIHNPLDMCSNCLCKLVVNEYIFDNYYLPACKALATSEKIYHKLLCKEKYFWQQKKHLQFQLQYQCVGPANAEREKKVKNKLSEVQTEINQIHNTLLALISRNAADGCDSKRRFNACSCPGIKSDEQQTCAYCLWWLANQPIFPSVFQGPISCNCAKCVPMSAEIKCACKTNSRGLEDLCVRCLCQLTLDYDAGKSICFCSKIQNQYSCGSDICVNPIRQCKCKIGEGGLTCDATKCVNSNNIPRSPASSAFLSALSAYYRAIPTASEQHAAAKK
jgi:hypothetical protein